jgi:hypothetical protein
MEVPAWREKSEEDVRRCGIKVVMLIAIGFVIDCRDDDVEAKRLR